MTSATLRRWITWTMVVILVLSLVVWYFTRESIPPEIRIATGESGGQYYEFGMMLKGVVEERTVSKVTVISTEGSRENLLLLRSNLVDLALIQGGSAKLDGFPIISPLFPDILQVVVRTNRGIDDIPDLAGRTVVLGGPGSGMRASAHSLLSHYGIADQVQESEQSYFAALPEDESIDAAIITSGIHNPDLRRILASGKFKMLPIRDAAAIELSSPYFRTFHIPRGLYREIPPIPEAPIETLSTTAFLAGSESSSELLVTELLAAIFEDGLRLEMPTLLSREESRAWLHMPLHPIARRYFDPQDEIGNLAAIMESLAATKELLFALAASCYLLWERWRRLKEQEERAEFLEQKSHLDDLLTRTVEIEARQINENDVRILKAMLDDVTRIKLQALQELTHEELRGDRSFLIFLTQCSSLITKIQSKIVGQPKIKISWKGFTWAAAAAGGLGWFLMNTLFNEKPLNADAEEETGSSPD